MSHYRAVIEQRQLWPMLSNSRERERLRLPFETKRWQFFMILENNNYNDMRMKHVHWLKFFNVLDFSPELSPCQVLVLILFCVLGHGLGRMVGPVLYRVLNQIICLVLCLVLPRLRSGPGPGPGPGHNPRLDTRPDHEHLSWILYLSMGFCTVKVCIVQMYSE